MANHRAKPQRTHSTQASVHLHEQTAAYQQGLSSWDDAHLLTRVISQSEETPFNQKRSLRSARRALDTIGMLGLVQALESQPESLLRFGFTETQLDRLTLAYELVSRCQRIQPQARTQIKTAFDAYQLFRPELTFLDHEELHVIALDTRNYVVEYSRQYKGTIDSTSVRISELLRIAVIRNCPRAILAHNHPSGESRPSPEDCTVTEQLVKAAKLLDIEILDHLVIGNPSFTSLKEMLQW